MTTKQETASAIEQLRELFPAGSTAHTIIRHVSRSGMQRAISVLASTEDGGVQDVSWMVARAVGWRLHTHHDGVKVDGCGMDMGFHLIYTMSQVVHGDGYAVSQRWV
jgi:hypothetical protein